VATFETKMRAASDVAAWFDGVHPIVVVEAGGRIVAFASTSAYRPRDCYAGIAEVSLYVDRAFRGRGAGRLAMQTIIHEAEKAGFWKLLSRVFLDNQPSRKLIAAAGFREVGIYKKHGKWSLARRADRRATDSCQRSLTERNSRAWGSAYFGLAGARLSRRSASALISSACGAFGTWAR
jgi:phosphinothricin acetyltransferase